MAKMKNCPVQTVGRTLRFLVLYCQHLILEREHHELSFHDTSNKGKEVFWILPWMIVLDARLHVITPIISMFTEITFDELFIVVYESNVSVQLPLVCKNLSTLVTFSLDGCFLFL